MAKRKTYTKEFKLEALRQWQNSGKSAAEVEEELDLSKGLLYSWRRQFGDEIDQVVPEEEPETVKPEPDIEPKDKATEPNETKAEENIATVIALSIVKEEIGPSEDESVTIDAETTMQGAPTPAAAESKQPEPEEKRDDAKPETAVEAPNRGKILVKRFALRNCIIKGLTVGLVSGQAKPNHRRPAPMLIDKHEADNILERIPGLIIKMSPELAAIDKVLDDDKLFCMIRNDLARRYPKTMTTGRKSTPVEVILRMLTIKHLYNLSYEQTELQVADSLVLRQFCRVYLQAAPDQSTLCRWANQIQPETLEAFNQRVLNLAIDSKLTRGRKLRMDGTAVETTIHYPTDSRLLADSVRVLGRTLTRAKMTARCSDRTEQRDLPQPPSQCEASCSEDRRAEPPWSRATEAPLPAVDASNPSDDPPGRTSAG